jgi:ATP-dependent DNA helicase RecQ
VPPYVVFNDTTLLEMAEHLPVSPGDLLDITGVGQRKLEKFGRPFMNMIRDHIDNGDE